MAGCARPPDHALLFPRLVELFPEADVQLTSDGQLLTAPLRRRISAPNAPRQCVTLICGTGSMAVHYEVSDGVRQIARRGGWGSLLGDEGSGWSMGRKAITSVLTYAANHQPPPAWHQRVLDRFGVTDSSSLLGAASRLDTSLEHGVADSERKKRIAGCTRVVIEAATEAEDEALRILRVVADEVVGEVLAPLMGGVSAGECMLVVGGGLGQVGLFKGEVEARMREGGWAWREVVYVDDPPADAVLSMCDADDR